MLLDGHETLQSEQHLLSETPSPEEEEPFPRRRIHHAGLLCLTACVVTATAVAVIIEGFLQAQVM